MKGDAAPYGRPGRSWVMLTGGMGAVPTRARLLVTVCATMAALAAPLAGCGNQTPAEATRAAHDKAKAAAEGVSVHPPFAVKGDASGLLLEWFDDKGSHTADDRNAIPAAHRAHVRVDSLRLAPDKRLDPAYVYVADLRKAQKDGSYPVRKVARSAYEAMIDHASAAAQQARADQAGHGAAGGKVIIYGAEWCGACKEAAHYLTAHHVPFVEKDIEKDPGALQEMQRKAQAAGLHPSGIPVIDVHGHIVMGFNAQVLSQLLGSDSQANGAQSGQGAAPRAI